MICLSTSASIAKTSSATGVSTFCACLPVVLESSFATARERVTVITRTSVPRPAYQYMDLDLDVMHVTSAPTSDEAALEYFKLVQAWFPQTTVQFIQRREAGQYVYQFMPFEYVDGEVKKLVTR